jgi:hypothetical protein
MEQAMATEILTHSIQCHHHNHTIRDAIFIYSTSRLQNLTLTLASKGKDNKPNKAKRTVNLNSVRGPKVVSKLIENQLDSTYYRRDLTKAALARYSAEHRVMRNEAKGVAFKTKTRRGKAL